MADVSKLEDHFILVTGMEGLKITKGPVGSGRGIKLSFSSLILSFNFVFYASRLPMDFSNA
jgi:hypothetical protein